VNRIDELAQNLPPARDLWPAIAQAIEADRAEAAAPQPATRARSRWLPAAGMAAAVALVTLGVVIGRSVAPPMVTVASTSATQGAADLMPAALRDTNYRQQRDALLRDTNYRQQRDALLVEVNDQLKTMPAAEREKVAASLATLRRSIGEIEAALGRDPANALLQELLVNSCQEEMRALSAVRAAGSQEI
jgi:N-acyl-D-aspartate/D-glutamate deacylase